jgi:hypothetical protein
MSIVNGFFPFEVKQSKMTLSLRFSVIYEPVWIVFTDRFVWRKAATVSLSNKKTSELHPILLPSSVFSHPRMPLSILLHPHRWPMGLKGESTLPFKSENPFWRNLISMLTLSSDFDPSIVAVSSK